ncbi:MAG TPA: proline--tRNA ligase [Bacilli bacterium]|nr:proline--tRNA ligase [Bacilli bacterium]
MMKNEFKNDAITRLEDDFAQWYTDVCRKAELMDYSSVKGFIIYRPYGYAIWENIQSYLDRRFKQTGHENVYMPLVIPASLFQKEKDHVEGFAPETLVATMGGKNKLEDPLIIRPTSEVLFCEHFSKIISSYRDLPKKYNQWCSVVRWEKTTRPFLRGSEFLWQEGHTMHESELEARQEALDMLQIYNDMGKDVLAIPFLTGVKTENEKFAGAVETYTIEALMPDGKALQSGTTHYFGDGFAKAFDIKYQDKTNKLVNPFQTSWGVSTRLIGSIIMVHGDDNGLSLPPYVAPTQVVIIPIQQNKPGVLTKAKEMKARLDKLGLRVKLDDSDRTPGWKFSEYEMKGVPIRLEIGPRDLENGNISGAKRYNGEKFMIGDADLEKTIVPLLSDIHDAMYQKALKYLLDHTTEAHDLDELDVVLNQKLGYAKVMWDGNLKGLEIIKERFSATARCMPFNQSAFSDKCVVSGKPAKYLLVVAKAY